MIEILKAAIQRGASDIHIKAGDNVRARILGSRSKRWRSSSCRIGTCQRQWDTDGESNFLCGEGGGWRIDPDGLRERSGQSAGDQAHAA